MRLLVLSCYRRIALTINKAILEPARPVWHTPATCLPTPKEQRSVIMFQPKALNFSSPTTPLNSLVVQAAKDRAKQQHSHFTLADKEGKHLDLLGCKVFSSSSLQFGIANYQAFVIQIWVPNYSQFKEFADSLPQHHHAPFQALVDKINLVAITTLQSAVDAADTSSRAMATGIVRHRESWLLSAGFPWEVQKTSEYLHFDESHLFNQKTDESLHTLKDSRASTLLPQNKNSTSTHPDNTISLLNSICRDLMSPPSKHQMMQRSRLPGVPSQVSRSQTQPSAKRYF